MAHYGLKVQGSILGGGEGFCLHQSPFLTALVPTQLPAMSIGVLTGVKLLGRNLYRHPLSSVEVRTT